MATKITQTDRPLWICHLIYTKHSAQNLSKSCENAGRLIYINKNKAMIDACDMAVFLF